MRALSGELPVLEVVEVREPGRIRVRVLGELDFIGLSGLRVVLTAAQQASRDGRAFALTRGSIRVARRLVETHATMLGAPQREDAILMVSELVTNALVHGTRTISLIGGSELLSSNSSRTRHCTRIPRPSTARRSSSYGANRARPRPHTPARRDHRAGGRVQLGELPGAEPWPRCPGPSAARGSARTRDRAVLV